MLNIQIKSGANPLDENDLTDAVKKAEKDKTISEDDSKKMQTEIQNITDKYTKEVDTVISNKEKEILAV